MPAVNEIASPTHAAANINFPVKLFMTDSFYYCFSVVPVAFVLNSRQQVSVKVSENSALC
jgi:hypothetical protein